MLFLWMLLSETDVFLHWYFSAILWLFSDIPVPQYLWLYDSAEQKCEIVPGVEFHNLSNSNYFLYKPPQAFTCDNWYVGYSHSISLNTFLKLIITAINLPDFSE